MPTSNSKDRVIISIREIPAHVSKQSFESNCRALADAVVALPVCKKNLLRYDYIFQTPLFDENLRAIGLPQSRPHVLAIAECVRPSSWAEMLADRELMKLVNEGEKFGFCSSATTFFADVVTKIDSPSAASDLGRVFFVFKAPARLPPEEFSRELEGVVDRCLALPICQRVLVRHSMLVPSKIGTDLQDNDGLLRALGLPTPEAVVVIIAEVESPDDFAEFFTDEFLVKEVVKEVKDKFEFHLNGVCFLGSVESKVNDL